MWCSNFVKFGWWEIGKIVGCLPVKKQNFTWLSSASCTKNLEGQPQTMYSEWPRFRQNRFAFSRGMPERVNTIKTGHEVFPIFGWSLASSRITRAVANNAVSAVLSIHWVRGVFHYAEIRDWIRHGINTNISVYPVPLRRSLDHFRDWNRDWFFWTSNARSENFWLKSTKINRIERTQQLAHSN